MSKRVGIKVYPERGLTRMIDLSSWEILVEAYDPDIDQETALRELAEKLGYIVVEEYEYEKQQ